MQRIIWVSCRFNTVYIGKDLSEAASKITVDDIGLLLERLGLQDGLKFAQTNLISGDVVYSYLSLPSLEESGLKDLGIHNKIDELKFRIQFKRLLEGKKLDYEFTPKLLGNFLTERNSLSRFAKVINSWWIFNCTPKNLDFKLFSLFFYRLFKTKILMEKCYFLEMMKFFVSLAYLLYFKL